MYSLFSTDTMAAGLEAVVCLVTAMIAVVSMLLHSRA